MKKTYIVEGMTCSACSAAVERIMRKTEGVESASVNLTTKKLTLEFDDAQVTFETIKTKIEKAGYQVEEEKVMKTIVLPIDGMT
jgi:Cu+-exporting ATPase